MQYHTVPYCTVRAGSNSDYAEATPLPNQRSSFKLFPYLSRLFSLNAFADLLSLFLSPPLPFLFPQNPFLLSRSLWCSVSCKHHKRQCSLFFPPFDVFVVLGGGGRAGPCARCLCSRKPLINTDSACLSVTAAIQSTPSLIPFFFSFLFVIFSYPPFFVSFCLYFSLFFLYKGTKLGQLAWTPKKHHAPLYPPNPLATFTQISQQLKIENNKKHENHSITRTTQSR